MTVLYILRLDGDADEIAAKVADVSDEAWSILADHGFVGETLGRTDEGVVIAEVWKSPDGYRDGIAHPVVQSEFARVAMPQVHVQGPYEVVRDFQPGRAS